PRAPGRRGRRDRRARRPAPQPAFVRGPLRATITPVEVLTPRSLAEALQLKAERPDAVPIQGGTDVMVELNFDRARPAALLNLNEVTELRGWSRENGSYRLGSGLTYTEAMQLAEPPRAPAEASRTVGGPQI